MRTIVFIFVFCFLALVSFDSHAANVFSTNGFKCTATPAKSGTLVDCDGAFPGVNGLFGATGYDIAHIEYSPDNKNRYTYMSDNGCLILTAADGTSVAVNRAGNRAKFNTFLDAMSWCYTGGQGQP